MRTLDPTPGSLFPCHNRRAGPAARGARTGAERAARYENGLNSALRGVILVLRGLIFALRRISLALRGLILALR